MAAIKESNSEQQTLHLDFSIDDLRKGQVTVLVQPNNDPARYGCTLLFPDKPTDVFATFPTCEALVRSTGATGYGSMYGWIQFFRASDSPLTGDVQWEVDPVPIFGDLNTPFCWFGPEPSLFDCPMREGKLEHDWICHSFLTYLPDCLISKDVRPILGFEWGFRIRESKVEVKELQEVEMKVWDERLAMLEHKYPGWAFQKAK